VAADMANQRLLQISGGAVLALAVFLGLKAYVHYQEQSRALQEARENVEEALDILKDHGEALRLSIEALETFPDDPLLHVYKGRAYHGRGRYKDALEALERAGALNDDPDMAERIVFYMARARALRFLETRDREDFNLAEGELQAAADGLEFSAAAKMLLGMMLAQPSRNQDKAEALRLIEAGLAEDPQGDGIADLDRVRRVAEDLRGELGN
jgi:tetratricopeptide (TPR) repeat protein